MNQERATVDQLITEIIKGIEEVKGTDISLLDLRKIENTVCDYFVLCSGTSNTQVNAIAQSIQKQVGKNLKEKPCTWKAKTMPNGYWLIMLT